MYEFKQGNPVFYAFSNFYYLKSYGQKPLRHSLNYHRTRIVKNVPMCTLHLLTQQLFDCFYVYLVVFKYILLKGLDALVLLNLNVSKFSVFFTNWS
jgi:hypothetical protein